MIQRKAYLTCTRHLQYESRVTRCLQYELRIKGG